MCRRCRISWLGSCFCSFVFLTFCIPPLAVLYRPPNAAAADLHPELLRFRAVTSAARRAGHNSSVKSDCDFRKISHSCCKEKPLERFSSCRKKSPLPVMLFCRYRAGDCRSALGGRADKSRKGLQTTRKTPPRCWILARGCEEARSGRGSWCWAAAPFPPIPSSAAFCRLRLCQELPNGGGGVGWLKGLRCPRSAAFQVADGIKHLYYSPVCFILGFFLAELNTESVKFHFKAR